ncbi:MAG: Hpt domain-containing protein [Bacteroidetes bacterium]|nr:Hpt domain-containing protein [Bacteroidota bacterium]
MNTPDKITNLDYLTELAKGNQEFINEMIQIFLNENPQEVNNLSAAIDRQDHAAIKSTAHKMKSTIPFVGVDKIIGNEVAEIEKLGTDKGDIQKIQTLFEKVKDICEKAAEELKAS